MISTSGSTNTEEANASRTPMPLEKVFSGCSMKSPSSENSWMRRKRSTMSSGV